MAGWAFDTLGLARLELTCGPDNEASQSVAVRCGFVREGVLRSHTPFKGGRRDTVMFSLLPDELRCVSDREDATGDGRRQRPARMSSSLIAPTLTSQSITLRPWRPADAEALEPACGDQDICRFTTVTHHYTREEAEAWIARQQQHLVDGTAIVLAIIPTGSEIPVGMVGLFGLNRGTNCARFGYWLIRSFRGQGLASAATRMLARWAFQELGLAALLFDVEPDNRGSQRVAEALGAQPLGEIQWPHAGENVTLLRYSLSGRPRWI
jgi:RimJ/RimL family protein N-acetyltransferase